MAWLTVLLWTLSSAWIPRVLYLTASKDGNGTLPQGAHLALEEFSRHGAWVTFHDKSILYEPDSLQRYRILIAPTLYDYHDQDRLLSLTYLDTLAMKNLLAWIQRGGILVAGGNLGRNTLAGEDRYLSGEILDRSEWPLGRALGFDLKEVNLQGLSLRPTGTDPPLLEWFPDPIAGPLEAEDWLLVPVHTEPDVQVLALWQNETTSYPAITLRRFGKGAALYFTTLLPLHPSFDGGWGDIPAILRFYHQLFRWSVGLQDRTVGISPWPAAALAALAVTVDDGGSLEEYQFLVKALLDRIPRITFFVTGQLDPEILHFIQDNPRIELGNHSYSHPRFPEIPPAEARRQILLARQILGPTAGFRFPYTMPSAAGILNLWLLGFEYQSSVDVNHLQFFRGALFPYNLVISPAPGLVLTTSLLEISPVESDWAFYKKLARGEPYPASEQARDREAFRAYLRTMWTIIREAGGAMVLLLHPMYAGHNPSLLDPVLSLLDSTREDPTVWIASLGEIAQWWRTLKQIRVKVTEESRSLRFHVVNLGDHPVDRFSLWLESPEGEPLPRVSTSRGVRAVLTERWYGDTRRLYLVLRVPPGESRIEVRWP